jgi:hypothetical protein
MVCSECNLHAVKVLSDVGIIHDRSSRLGLLRLAAARGPQLLPSRHRKNAPYAGHVSHGDGAETATGVEWGTAYPTWKLIKTSCDSGTPVILLPYSKG